MKSNTAIAALMALLNTVTDTGSITRGELRCFLLLLNPFAPHMTEEMWQLLSFGGMLNEAAWPGFDEDKCRVAEVEIAVQVCGKIRARLMIPAAAAAADVLALAKENEKIAAEISGKQIVKELYVPGKLVNIVAK